MSSKTPKSTSRTSSRYQEFLPPPSLAHRLVCLWTQHIDGPADDHYEHGVLPDGCVDIVCIGNRPPVVAGPATQRIVVTLPTACKIIGIRFRPGHAATSLGVPANEMLNQDVPAGRYLARRRGSLIRERIPPPGRIFQVGSHHCRIGDSVGAHAGSRSLDSICRSMARTAPNRTRARSRALDRRQRPTVAAAFCRSGRLWPQDFSTHPALSAIVERMFGHGLRATRPWRT